MYIMHQIYCILIGSFMVFICMYSILVSVCVCAYVRVCVYHGWWTSFRRNGVRNDLCDWFASTSGASLRRKSATQEQILQFSK